MTKKVLLKFALIFFLSTVITVLLQRIFDISFTNVKDFINSFGSFAPLVYSFVLFAGLSVPFNPVPDVLTVNLAALLFPPVSAILATFLGQFLALTTNYWIARHWADDVLKRILSKEEYAKIDELSRKVKLSWVFGFRFLLPLTAIGIDVVSYAAGLAKLDYGKFLLVSLIPWTFYSVFYFFSTHYLKGIDPLLFFVPAALVLGIPTLYLAFRHKDSLKDRVRKYFGRN